jgi:hypothetical protein
MPKLSTYRQFEGRHWETGSLCNVFAYQGVKAPHTGKPVSEALLLGISGGLLMGYFSFAYEGYDPHVAILTRNTFNPMDTMLVRLGVIQNVRQTTSADKGLANLLDALEDGLPAIVWADLFSLPYNALPYDEGMWQMAPIVVYGYEEASNTVWVADRARVPLTITPADLAKARARVKKDKFRLLTLDPPDLDKLAVAVQQGIWDCVKRYVEAPVAHAKNSFGLAAFQRWADLLTLPKQKLSWEREFPAGPKMYAGLTSAYKSIALVPGEGQAERDVYADFLDEASALLGNPALGEAATRFRASGRAWRALANALLPDDAPAFKETRELLARRYRLFVDKGGAALPEIQQIDARLGTIKAGVSKKFPLAPADVVAMRENLRDRVMQLRALEQEAHATLRAAMANAPASRAAGRRSSR